MRTALLANALFSASCGLIMILNPAWVGALLGFEATRVFMLVGAGLVLFATDLVHQATRTRMQTWRALYASAADILWVLGSILGVLLFGEWLSASGMITVVTVTGIVLAFGISQLWGIDRLHRNPETGLYRHCILVDTHAQADKLWKIIRDLGAISRYMSSLRDSVILDGKEPGAGAVRRCVDQTGRAWSEECTVFDEAGRRFVVHFRADELGFPFPARRMVGGWKIMPAAEGSTVMIWWELEPKPKWLASLMLPVLAFQVDRDFPKLIGRMAEAATLSRRNTAGAFEEHQPARLLARWC
ncbi:MAG: SRPBCC family protein [Gammaproteobacteria bacterium]|nr:SRPBCC family protein [Gammaproteobacteria bacterium]